MLFIATMSGIKSLNKPSILLLFTILAAGAISSCTGKKSASGTLHIPMSIDAKSLDPAHVDDRYSAIATAMSYEGLVEYEYLKRPHELKPLLAESMPTISKDGLTYTFKIKKGVKFIDSPNFEGGKGRELKAKDFVYSFKRIADPKVNSGGFWIFDGKIKGLNAWREANKKSETVNYDTDVEGLKAIDDSTFQITLTTPYPQLLFVLAMPYSFAVPREVVEKLGKDFPNTPTGTGPYVLERWMRGSKIIFNKNPTYHGGTYPTEGEAGDKEKGLLADAGKALPLMERVELSIFTESQPQWLNFLKGNLDYTGIPKDNFDSVIDPATGGLKEEFTSKDISLVKAPSADVTYIAFNMMDPFIVKAGPKFRQALSLAINEEEKIKMFYNDRGIVAHSPVPPGLAGYDETYKNPWKIFNLEKAKKLLAEAGFADGKGVPVIPYETSTGAEARQMAEDLQRSLGKMGIKLQINVNQFAELLEKIDQKKAMMWGVAWGADYPDAENFLQLLYGPNKAPGPNGSNFDNAEYNKLYEQMRYMLDSPERRKIITRMKEVFAEQMPWIPSMHRVVYTLTHPWMKNFKPEYMGATDAKFLRVNDERRIQGVK